MSKAVNKDDDEEMMDFEDEVQVEINFEDQNKKVKETFEEKISEQDASDRWKNRRRMSWLSLISMLVITALCLFIVPADRLSEVKDIVIWVNMSLTSVIGFYMGATAYVDKFRDIKGFKN